MGWWWLVYNHVESPFWACNHQPSGGFSTKDFAQCRDLFFKTRSWWSPGSSSSLSAPYMVAFEGVQSRGAHRWTSRFILYIYIATEKMRILVPWPFWRVNFELFESREKKKNSSHQHHFQLHHSFSCPKSRSSNNLPYRFFSIFVHLDFSDERWWEEYIPNGHQIKRNMMINYI